LDFNSYNPTSHKRAVVKSLLDRSNKICAGPNKVEEDCYIRESLLLNNYPIDFIKPKQRNRRITEEDGIQPLVKRVAAPYIKNITEKINRYLKPYNIQMAPKPTVTLKSKLCKLKDRREVLESKEVVYEVNCLECEASYYGETGRQLGKRVDEHQNNVQKKNNTSLIYQHVKDFGHKINFDDVKIVDRASNVKERRFLEAMHTKSSTRAYNRSIDIPTQYIPIVKKFIENS
jgi:hypothetical protein